MRRTRSSIAASRILSLLTIAAAVTGCASKHDTRDFRCVGSIQQDDSRFGRCRLLEREARATRSRLHVGAIQRNRCAHRNAGLPAHGEDEYHSASATTCADNRNGTSIVFVTADRE